MADITGKYELVSSEKFEEYMEDVGVGIATRKIASLLKPTTVITKEGDEYQIRTLSTFKNIEIKFKLGQEFDEETPDGRKCTSVITMENDKKMKHVQKLKGTDTELVSYREFSDEGMTVTLETPKVVCKRIYKKSS